MSHLTTGRGLSKSMQPNGYVTSIKEKIPFLLFFFFFLGMEAYLNVFRGYSSLCTQRSLLVGVGLYGRMLGIEARSAICKASTLPSVSPLQFLMLNSYSVTFS